MTNQDISATPAGGITFVDLLIGLARHKKKVVLFPLVAATVALAISFALPDIYSANTKLLPPQQPQSGASALLAQLGGMAGAAGAAAGLKSPNDVYIGMLKSRTVADRLIATFNLKQAYQTPSLEMTRAKLEASTTVSAGKDGLIVIEIEDTDRQRAAQLANAYVAELLRLTKYLAVTEASQRRLFFEQQLTQAKDNLAKAEVALKQGMDTGGVISVDAESAALVAASARLKAQRTAKEIELNSMKAFVTTSNPEYRRVAEELNSLREELAKLENGRPAEGPAASKGGFDNIRILRDVKYYQMLYELLAKQFEVARLDEAKDSSLIQVLDPAEAPERRARPKRALIVVLAALFGLFASLAYIFVAEVRLRAERSPDSAGKWAELRAQLRGRGA